MAGNALTSDLVKKLLQIGFALIVTLLYLQARSPLLQTLARLGLLGWKENVKQRIALPPQAAIFATYSRLTGKRSVFDCVEIQIIETFEI